MNSVKVNCQAYEIDYKKVVQEIQETLYTHEQELKNKLQDETSPIRYIELNARLTDVKQLMECIYSMFEYCKKPVDAKQDDQPQFALLKEVSGNEMV